MGKRAFLGFLFGSVVGAGISAVAGMLFAPRSGAESRAMAADAVNDAWDTAVDTYERGTKVVQDTVNERVASVRGAAAPADPEADAAAADDLRAKVDLAREKMDEIRANLSDQVSAAATAASDTVSSVVSQVADVADSITATQETPAEAVKVEVEEDEYAAAADDAADAADAEDDAE